MHINFFTSSHYLRRYRASSQQLVYLRDFSRKVLQFSFIPLISSLYRKMSRERTSRQMLSRSEDAVCPGNFSFVANVFPHSCSILPASRGSFSHFTRHDKPLLLAEILCVSRRMIEYQRDRFYSTLVLAECPSSEWKWSTRHIPSSFQTLVFFKRSSSGFTVMLSCG